MSDQKQPSNLIQFPVSRIVAPDKVGESPAARALYARRTDPKQKRRKRERDKESRTKHDLAMTWDLMDAIGSPTCLWVRDNTDLQKVLFACGIGFEEAVLFATPTKHGEGLSEERFDAIARLCAERVEIDAIMNTLNLTYEMDRTYMVHAVMASLQPGQTAYGAAANKLYAQLERFQAEALDMSEHEIREHRQTVQAGLEQAANYIRREGKIPAIAEPDIAEEDVPVQIIPVREGTSPAVTKGGELMHWPTRNIVNPETARPPTAEEIEAFKAEHRKPWKMPHSQWLEEFERDRSVARQLATTIGSPTASWVRDKVDVVNALAAFGVDVGDAVLCAIPQIHQQHIDAMSNERREEIEALSEANSDLAIVLDAISVAYTLDQDYFYHTALAQLRPGEEQHARHATESYEKLRRLQVETFEMSADESDRMHQEVLHAIRTHAPLLRREGILPETENAAPMRKAEPAADAVILPYRTDVPRTPRPEYTPTETWDLDEYWPESEDEEIAVAEIIVLELLGPTVQWIFCQGSTTRLLRAHGISNEQMAAYSVPTLADQEEIELNAKDARLIKKKCKEDPALQQLHERLRDALVEDENYVLHYMRHKWKPTNEAYRNAATYNGEGYEQWCYTELKMGLFEFKEHRRAFNAEIDRELFQRGMGIESGIGTSY